MRLALVLLVSCTTSARTDSQPLTAATYAAETDRLSWLVSLLNGAQVTDSELAAGFTSDFIAALTLPGIRQTLQTLAAAGPYEVMQTQGQLTVLTNGLRRYERLFLATSGDQIAGLQIAPAGDLDPALDSEDEVLAALQQLAPKAVYLHANADCSPRGALHADQTIALGSAFKLFVLATLQQDVAQGLRSWTDEVTITDAWKSLPSGKMQDLPEGTRVSLLTLAQEMIRISDNTATDHLIHTLGAEHIQALTNTPFLTTRQMFTLKLMLNPAEQAEYLAADADGKRVLLAQYDARDPRTYTGDWPAPIHVSDIEWFASPADLCGVMQTLHTVGGPAFDALTFNPGFADTTGAFDRIAYKGGSEPGVLTMTWFVHRTSDDTWRLVSLGLNDENANLDQEAVLYVAAAARALAAQ